ncbi:hypothetical protein Pst134EA_013196 [Puccinia striiformis f. sp. tritici]|uniref:hypothetical protein n=1 Tax=Puccinia striiformis f. sp. tritici TaxID=168172 RepID=UPI002008BE2D|nr:hypothetical protein Pst134EA_013196 [Puccinia striiformis f. sp. tritici]KAH9454102.1 hypothetical protein Pst134EB_014197 [Puccinia striiformis f. sp. tritici]KAH9465306.1 hypothetical protein Pst134EA_013196 [Puccinia striiformis f. sp. tritici]
MWGLLYFSQAGDSPDKQTARDTGLESKDILPQVPLSPLLSSHSPTRTHTSEQLSVLVDKILVVLIGDASLVGFRPLPRFTRKIYEYLHCRPKIGDKSLILVAQLIQTSTLLRCNLHGHGERSEYLSINSNSG